MKDKTFYLNTILAVVLGVLLLAVIAVRVFVPVAMLPEAGITDLVLVSLIALVIDHYMTGGESRNYIWIFVLSVLSFGILPWAAGAVCGVDAVKTALVGGIVFTAVTWLYSSMQDRMKSGNGSKVTPVMCALGLYLAVQGFAGMIL